MSILSKIILAAAGAGVVIGGLLGVLTAPDGTAGTLARDAVPVYACPGDTEVGTLYRGDRVLVIGRSGDWLAVRNVRGAGERVFVLAATIIPDADLSGLPEVDCDAAGTVAFEGTTTTIESDTTTTTGVGDTTTTVPGASTTVPAVTTTVPVVTTTTAPDQTPPVIANAHATPETIHEVGGVCQPPHQATISAHVTDVGGVATVTASWTIPGLGLTSELMQQNGSTYSTTFGPYPGGTWSNTDPFTNPVTVTVTAVDMSGNGSSDDLLVNVVRTGGCVE